MSGNSIGSLLGAGIGFLVGGPTGAKWGFVIGGAIGGYVDPVRVKGPRLTDAQQQTSQEGVPIPWGYGTFPTTGNIIFASDLTEHEHEEGGKGGGQKTTTFTYTRSFAIGICSGPDDGTGITAIVQVKQNGKLVYDITPTSTLQAESSKFLEDYTFYLGTDTQTVDPTIESIVGVGNSGPMRRLAYMVGTDVDLTETQGAIHQFEFVVQMCGAVATIIPDRFLATVASTSEVKKSAVGDSWRITGSGLGGAFLRYCASNGTTVVANDASGNLYRSTDGGETFALVDTISDAAYHMEYQNGLFVGIRWVGGLGGTISCVISNDDGQTWSVGGTIVTGNAFPNGLAAGKGVFVFVAGNAAGGIWSSRNGVSWTFRDTLAPAGVGFNGVGFLAADIAVRYSTDGNSWIDPGGTLPSLGYAVTGGQGYFVVGTFNHGIYRTTNNGASFSNVLSVAATPLYSAAAGNGNVVIGSGGGGALSQYVSHDSGATFALISPSLDDTDVIYLGPSSSWYAVPDAPGVYVDQDGNVNTDFIDTAEASSCGATLYEIVNDLCKRSGVDVATEVDTSELTDFVAGFKCATESPADGFIEALTTSHFFDRAEWDKKLRFPKRGGAVVAALTVNDLIRLDGPPIVQTRIQEPELLRKVNILSIDPAAGYNVTKQSWERRSGTISAKGEASFEIPEVVETDTAAQIAEIRGKIAWSETDKFRFGYTVKFSKLTPTDNITVTDKDNIVHRMRLADANEELGRFMIEEGVKSRASIYTGTAEGTTNPNSPGTTSPGLVGPTLFAAMNLPSLRSQDGSGLYVGMTGITPGWAGAQLLMSVDAGLTYSIVLTVTRPTKMGPLTADVAASGSHSEPLEVHIYGGQLSNATTGQVARGINWSAVQTEDSSGPVAEVLAYETAAESPANYYALSVLSRALNGTVANDHYAGDMFMDLATSHFLPIDTAFAGQTLLFKAVGIGVSPDAIDPVAVVYDPPTFFFFGGTVT